MLKKIRVFISLLIAVGLNSCSLLDLYNENGLQQALTTIFARYEVNDLNLQCHIPASSRQGTCVFSSSPEIVNRLVRGFPLKNLALEDKESFYKIGWEIEKGKGGNDPKVNCHLMSDFMDHTSVNVYAILKEPHSGTRKELAIGNGSSFARLFLYYRPDINKACVQVTYSYG